MIASDSFSPLMFDNEMNWVNFVKVKEMIKKFSCVIKGFATVAAHRDLNKWK